MQVIPQRQPFFLGQEGAQFHLAPVALQRQVIRHRAAGLMQADLHPIGIGLPILPPSTRPVAGDLPASGPAAGLASTALPLLLAVLWLTAASQCSTASLTCVDVCGCVCTFV